MESNDSPEIPDRGETSVIPGLPSGGVRELISTSKKKEKEMRRRRMNGRTFPKNPRKRGKSHHHHQYCPSLIRSSASGHQNWLNLSEVEVIRSAG